MSLKDLSAYDERGFINWPLIMSFDARYTMIIDARGRGKTFGLRLQCVNDYIRRGKRFVELSRVADFLQGDGKLQQGYFDKYYAELPDHKICRDYLLETRGKHAYIAKQPEDGTKPTWDVLAYFLALNDAENIKRRSNSFKPVRRYIFDEALIDKTLPGARYRDYLQGEISAVASIMTSVGRERPDTPEEDRPRLYLLGNAVDLTCPWLAHMGIRDVPPEGFSWHFNKQCLLWYGPSNREWAQAQDSSVAGALMAGSELNQSSNLNQFATMDESYFSDVPRGAAFSFGVVYQGNTYGVWVDMAQGYYYVDARLPKATDNKPIYALTTADARPNYILARRAQKSLKGFVDLYYAGIVKYKDHATREGFLNALSLFGVR